VKRNGLDKIVNQIIDYARPRDLVPGLVTFTDLVQEILKLLDLPISNKRIEVTCDVSSELPSVYADRDQLEQVLLNVVQNSIEAVAEGGTMHIQLARCLMTRKPMWSSGSGIMDAASRRTPSRTSLNRFSPGANPMARDSDWRFA
jgi:nitrogen fixation/metabolism regulation signal transduction histidine kinase